MQVIKPGSRVCLPDGEIRNARVRAVEIRECGVSYQVCWWVNGERNEAWLASFEVQAEPVDYVPVGFR